MTQRSGAAVLEAQRETQPSLRERWREAWSQQPPLMEAAGSPETMNYAGMGSYMAASCLVFCSSFFYLVPHVCSADDVAHIGLFLRLLIFLNTSAANINWLLCAERKSQFVTDATISAGAREKLAAAPYLPLGYHFCSKCQLYAPPRAFHCHLCHACVLKRDYHCYVTGACVGFTSQRRYLPFLFHVTAGGIIHGALAAAYLNTQLPFTSEYVTYVPFVAAGRCALGEVSLGNLYFMCMMYSCFSVSVVAWFYLMWEWLMVVRGQTSYEATRSIQTYRVGFFKSLYSVFGAAWFLNFLVPLPTTIPGDGVNWERRNMQKAN